jgi:hypothetical protein
MADGRPVETLVERDDGVSFAMRGAGGGAQLPHDLVHALVETAVGIADGTWGCVADGVVWHSMRHVSGRQPPHAAERSTRLKKERAAAIRRAEAVADVVSRLAPGGGGPPGWDRGVGGVRHPARRGGGGAARGRAPVGGAPARSDVDPGVAPRVGAAGSLAPARSRSRAG